MKRVERLVVERLAFLEDVVAIARPATGRQQIAVLNHIRLAVTGKPRACALAATNLDRWMLTTHAPKLAAGRWWRLAPAKKLIATLKAFTTELVTITAIEGEPNLMIEAEGEGSVKLHGVDPESFPKMPDADTYGGVVASTMPMQPLLDAIAMVRDATEAGDSRFRLDALQATWSGTGFELAATDGHRLAVAPLDAKLTPRSKLVTVLWPTAAVDDLVAGGVPDSGKVRLTMGKSHGAFFAGRDTIIFRAVEGTFPDISRVMPKPPLAFTALVSVDEVARVAAFAARMDVKHLELRAASSRRLMLSGVNGELSLERTVRMKGEGKPVTVALNPAYLEAALRGIGGEEVLIGLQEGGRPAAFAKPDNPERVLHIVMPRSD